MTMKHARDGIQLSFDVAGTVQTFIAPTMSARRKKLRDNVKSRSECELVHTAVASLGVCW
jgi:hypothetical protein